MEHEEFFFFCFWAQGVFVHFCSLKKHTLTFCLCKSDLPLPDVTVIVSGRYEIIRFQSVKVYLMPSNVTVINIILYFQGLLLVLLSLV
jgi:hypothetical protein